MTKNYIFDFGNVLVKFEPAYMTKQYIANPEDIELVSEVLFDRLYWDKSDEGTISDDEIKEAVCERLPERLRDSARQIYDNWYHYLPGIEGMKEILLRLKKEGHGLYLLSNISDTFAKKYAEVPQLKELFSLFDGLVFSAPLHMVKPTAEIFDYLLCKYHLAAKECTFVDDSEKNIIGARKVGIHGILFDGNAENLSQEIFS